MKKAAYAVLIALGSLASASQALACAPGPINCGPPGGVPILDLNGTAIPHSYTQYHTTFVAAGSSTNLSFAFREDPAFLFLDDVSVTQGGGPNLVTNGGFEDGPLGASAPNGWSYLNAFGASFGGVVSNNGPHSGSNNYFDGAVQAYDGITQAIATTAGLTYDVNFWLMDDGGLSTFSSVSTNGDVTNTGGNGADLVVYGGLVPTPTPEPETYALMLAGLGLLGVVARRRNKKA
jgi:hypothetical protein